MISYLSSRFDTIPECDTHTHTHTQTYDDGIYRASIALRGKNLTRVFRTQRIANTHSTSQRNVNALNTTPEM